MSRPGAACNALRVSDALVAAAVLLSAQRASAQVEPAAEPTIVVPGEPRPRHQASREPSVASTVLDRAALDGPGVGVAGALRGTPGASVSALGGFGAYATAGLRGASAAQTPVYLGGVRLNDEVGGAVNLGTIPLWFIERIEVYRGNAPVEADRLGIGGAIFLEPRRPKGTALDLGALAGSFGTRALWLAASAGDAADGVIAGVGLGAADNDYAFEDDRGTLFDPSDDRTSRWTNADASLLDVWLNARRRVGGANLALLAHYGRAEHGVPRLALLPSRAAREDVDRALVAISARAAFGAPGEWLEAATSALASTTRLDDPLRELGAGAGRIDLSGARVEQSVALRLTPHPAWLVRPSLVVSTDRLERREARDSAASEPVLNAARFDLRPATALEFRFLGTPWSLRALVALECTSAERAGVGACDGTRPTGRVGPTLRAGNWFSYGNLGRYVRSPTLGELFGTSLLVRGNPRLRPEDGLSADVGTRYSAAALLDFWVDVAAFARLAGNIITYARAAQGYVVPENRDRARVLGLELSTGFAPFAGVALDLTLTAIEPRDVSEERTLTNDVLPLQSRLAVAPAIRASRELDSSLVSSLAAHARYVYQSNRYADRAGLALIPEQANLELELEATWFSHSLSSRFRIENALNEARFDVVGFPLPGRAFFLSLETHY